MNDGMTNDVGVGVDARRRDKLSDRSRWLERESHAAGTDDDGASTRGGGGGAETPSRAGRAPTPGSTRAAEARARASAARRAEDAAATAALAGKPERRMTREEMCAISDRLHRGVGAGASTTVKTPTRGAVEEACTFTPKISAASRRLVAKYSAKEKNDKATTSHDGTNEGLSSATMSPSAIEGAASARAPSSTHEKLYRSGLEKIKSRRGIDGKSSSGKVEASPSPIPASRLSVVRYGLAAAERDADLRALRERDELKELNESCTFAPVINATSKKLGAHIMPNVDFIERSKVWAARKQNVLDAEREAQRDEEIAHCTFEPRPISSSTSRFTTPAKTAPSSTPTTPISSTPTETKGLRAYLARQESARKMRDERNAALAGLTGATWRNENTVPVEFSFSTTASAAHKVANTANDDAAAEDDANGTPPNFKSAYADARAKFYGARRARS